MISLKICAFWGVEGGGIRGIGISQDIIESKEIKAKTKPIIIWTHWSVWRLLRINCQKFGIVKSLVYEV